MMFRRKVFDQWNKRTLRCINQKWFDASQGPEPPFQVKQVKLASVLMVVDLRTSYGVSINLK